MISIRLLGRFSITVDGEKYEALTGESPKGMALLQYLLLRDGETVTREALQELIWPGEDPGKSAGALKTLISRVRALLENIDPSLRGCLTTERAAYCWRSQGDVFVDTTEFVRLRDRLLKARSADEEMRRDFRALLSLYRGELLTGRFRQSWMDAYSRRFREDYLRTVLNCLSLVESAGDARALADFAMKAVSVYPADPALRKRLDHANQLIGAESAGEAAPVAGRVAQRDAAENPGEVVRSDLTNLQTEIDEDASHMGALACELNVFKDIYRLQLRTLERQNANICLATASLSPDYARTMPAAELELAMKDMMRVLENNLRRGDVVTRLSDLKCMFLMTTPGGRGEDKVLGRIRGQFLKRHSELTPAFRCETVAIRTRAQK